MGLRPTKGIKETDLFRRISFFVTDKDKEELEKMQVMLALNLNMQFDQSTLIRAIIRYLRKNPHVLKELEPYIKEVKGFTILEQFNQMLQENRNIYEIRDRLGISIDLIKELKDKKERFEKEQMKS